jgi:hypothetical protein
MRRNIYAISLLRIGPAVSRLDQQRDGVVAFFKRYFIPRKLEGAESQIAMHLGLSNSIDDLVEKTGRPLEEIVHLAHSLEQMRIARIITPTAAEQLVNAGEEKPQ